jgi:hypothetical protein
MEDIMFFCDKNFLFSIEKATFFSKVELISCYKFYIKLCTNFFFIKGLLLMLLYIKNFITYIYISNLQQNQYATK